MAAERATLALLMAAMLVAFFAANSAATRSPHGMEQRIPLSVAKTAAARAVIGSAVGDDEPCCECACIFEWLSFVSVCECRGDWEGSCPAICSQCECDDDNICTCLDGYSHNDLLCAANECPPFQSKGRRPTKSSLPASTKKNAV